MKSPTESTTHEVDVFCQFDGSAGSIDGTRPVRRTAEAVVSTLLGKIASDSDVLGLIDTSETTNVANGTTPRSDLLFLGYRFFLNEDGCMFNRTKWSFGDEHSILF